MKSSTSDQVVERNTLNYTLFDDIDMENRLFVSWKMFEDCVKDLHDKTIAFQNQHNKEFKDIYALPKGGLCLGVKLSYLLKLPLLTNKKEISDSTLIVDDCTDTGKTLSAFSEHVTVVMFHKPTSVFTPDIIHKETSKQLNFCWESKEQRN